MPDGYSKRHSPGDRPPARRTTPRERAPDPAYDDTYGDDESRRRGRPGRRFAEWLGFGREDVYDDERTDDDFPPRPEEDRRAARRGERRAGPRDEQARDPYDDRPRSRRAERVDARRDVDEIYDQERDDSPRRSSPWDIMLGAPAPGTPMTDAVPRDTLPPDGVPGSDTTAELAAPPRAPRHSDPVARRYARVSEAPDPMDPVDPLDPRDPGGEAAPRPAQPLPAPTLPVKPPARRASADTNSGPADGTSPPDDAPTGLHALVVPSPRGGSGADVRRPPAPVTPPPTGPAPGTGGDQGADRGTGAGKGQRARTAGASPDDASAKVAGATGTPPGAPAGPETVAATSAVATPAAPAASAPPAAGAAPTASATSGVPGPSGFSGASGASGVPGASGVSGASGVLGASGPSGASADDDPAPRRMLRMMPSPVLADGGGLVADGGTVGRTVVRTSGLRGRLHQHQGIARQNCFAVGPDRERRWTIAILADGVTGTYAAELAAQVAVRSTYRAVARMVAEERHENWDWESLGSDLDRELADRLGEIGRRGAELGRTPPATRLAILVTAANPMEDDRVDMAVVGDSTILRLAKGGWRAPLGLRDTELETPPAALPGSAGGAPAELRVCRTTWRPTDALVMMTGGFADALGDPTGGLAPELAERWRTAPEPLAFLGDIADGLGSRPDDAAVVALWPTE